MELKNFATFDELLEHWEIPDFELLKCIQSGLIAYDRLGKRTITEKEVIHEPVETVDEYRKRLILGESNAEQLRIEKINSAEYRYNAHRLGIELPPPEVYNYDKVLQRVESRIDREYEEYKKLESFPRVPPDRRLIPSELDDTEAVKLLNKTRTFLFCHEDVNKFANDHGYPLINDGTNIDKSGTSETAETSEAENFIRDLKVSYLDNTEVKIQYKGKRKNYTCESMGFRDSKTEEWKTFLKILEAMDDEYREHTYRLGPAHYINKNTHQKERIGEYDRRLRLLKELDKKIITFLTKHYNVTFPAGFKSYERQPTKGKGIYSFKFQMPLATATPSYKTKEQALEYLEMLVRDRSSKDLINEALLTAIDGGASKDEVSRIVKDMCLLQDENPEVVDDLK